MVNEKPICPNCKKELTPSAIFCPYCGLKLKSSVLPKKLVRICKKCGAQINTLKLSYCPLCLTILENPRVPKK